MVSLERVSTQDARHCRYSRKGKTQTSQMQRHHSGFFFLVRGFPCFCCQYCCYCHRLELLLQSLSEAIGSHELFPTLELQHSLSVRGLQSYPVPKRQVKMLPWLHAEWGHQEDVITGWPESWTQAIRGSSRPSLSFMFCPLFSQWEPFQGLLQKGKCCWGHLDWRGTWAKPC